MTGILHNASALAAGALCAAAWTGAYCGLRSAAKVKRAADRMRRDADTIAWAQATIIAVTDADGAVFHRSLLALQDTGDLEWDRPRRVAISRAGADSPEPAGLTLDRHA